MGSGFKDWTAGDVLTAADVDGYLMRQTVMTFADASARDTALSGVLNEGMMAYLEDTDVTTFYDGSNWIATNNPSLIATATLSGATTTFSSIPATFKSLRVVLDDVIVSDASVGINLTLNNDTAANYTQVVTRAEDGDSGTNRQLVGYGNQTSHFVTFNNMRGAAGTGGGDRQNQFLIDLPNYSQAVAYKNVVVRNVYFVAGAATYHATVIDGSWKNVAAITEIDLNVSAGTFTSGTAYLYGY